MFIDIWDKENSAIKINKFNKPTYEDSKCKNKCRIELISTIRGFDQTLYFHFSLLYDCFAFLISDTFCYLYDSEDINYIKVTQGRKIVFKYDNRYKL